MTLDIELIVKSMTIVFILEVMWFLIVSLGLTNQDLLEMGKVGLLCSPCSCIGCIITLFLNSTPSILVNIANIGIGINLAFLLFSGALVIGITTKRSK